MICQVAPLSRLAPTTLPREPPFDQRSCCHAPMMLSPLAGLTSTNGSTSLFRKFSPVWPARPQFDPANGLVPDTRTREPTTYELAPATCGKEHNRRDTQSLHKPKPASLHRPPPCPRSLSAAKHPFHALLLHLWPPFGGLRTRSAYLWAMNR